ncbi:unnamed protein product (macronuclear) [Paramecium tetraurelia]|uniref:PHD-type domain-containing protein n=1 Tax=Paramecium tetraurelia TaxID=5888 RepID=A0BBQ9_PARTE|nr:uncharacterized protein GSPATT00000411001 [Paramecium tetraurelia]CAK55976.1 unnamed protein product [Paramecium tetraurelia]|eukprot:XP_001423374.1 hypothetical protein (macronuclear) [Paramecium tetraurelia strain d4-2]
MISNSLSQKIQLRNLTSCNQEYKQIPIEIKAFEQLHKRLYEYVLDLVEKITKFTKTQQTKTRLGQQNSNQGERIEKITLAQAGKFNQQILQLIVTCDEFDSFNELYEQAIELNERARSQIDDPEMQQRLLMELLDCPFYLDVQEKLQSIIDYSQILDQIKQHMSSGQHQEANDQIQTLLNRGIINEDLKQLQDINLKVLEWNQLANEIINYHDSISLVDVYQEDFEIKQYPNTLFQPPQDIIKQLDPEKVQQINKIAERVQIWKDQLISLIDNKQLQVQQTNKKSNQNKSFNKLWELFKEGLKYKQELSLMVKVRQIILQILDWHAQVGIIKQTLRVNDDTTLQIDGMETIRKLYIQKHGFQQTQDQIDKLQQFQSPFISGNKDLQIIQALTQHIEKWNKNAQEAVQTQNQELIKNLLDEAPKLPVEEQLVKELQNLHASSLKVGWIKQIIQSQDPLFESIMIALQNDESIKQLKEEMLRIYAQNPQNKKKKEGTKLSKLAQNFFFNFQNTIKYYLKHLTNLDENKLKKLQPVKVSKLKDYQRDLQNDEISQQVDEWIDQFQQWQYQILNLNDEQQPKKKKKSKDSESQPESYFLTGDLLYYFKVPELLCLVLSGIEKNYISQELVGSIEKLVTINNQADMALKVSSIKDVHYYSQVFMPEFYVMDKKFRVINNWLQMAQEMINDTPRLKNLIMVQKLKPFLDYVDQIQLQELKTSQSQQQQQQQQYSTITQQQQSQTQQQLQQQQQQQQQQISNTKKKMFKSINKLKIKSQEESQPIVDQESVSIKHSKRVKQVSKLMRDDNIAFYDANVPLGKAFKQSPNEIQTQDPVIQSIKKNNNKRCYKKGLNRKVLPNLEVEINNPNFLEWIKMQSQELLNLYSQEEIYCICRQGGESAISDLQIIKSLNENNVQLFHQQCLKQQQQVKYMIFCDICEEWYHYECMGIKKLKEQSQDKYICRICLMKFNMPFLILNENLWDQYIDSSSELHDSYQKQKQGLEKNILPNSGEYIYSQLQLPTVDEFKDFLKIGKSLPAQLVELEILELLEQKLDQWLVSYTNLKNYSFPQILALYAEGEWLPINLPQQKILLSIICQKEFLCTANELLQSRATFKTKQLKKPQMDKTEQLYAYIKEQQPELLQESDHQVIKTIQMLRVQQDLNNQFQSQLKQQQTLEQYDQLAIQYEKEIKLQIQKTEIKFSLPKLNELRQQITKIQQWNAEILAIFKDVDDIYTSNLSQQFYDSKPNFSDIQVKLKEYEMITLKIPNLYYEFLKTLQSKAEDIIIKIDSNVCQLSFDEQFDLCRTAYQLKCKIPQFKDLANNVSKDVQMRILQWLPYIKARLY